MKILFVIRSLGPGGAERQLVNLANGLASRGHSVHIATFYEVGGLATEIAPTVTLHNLRKKSRWDLVRLVFNFLKLTRVLQPNIVHSYMPSSNLLACLTRLTSSAKVVWGVRSSKISFSLYNHGWTSRLLQTFTRIASSQPDLIICNSEAGRAWCAEQGFPEYLLHVIPNGINPSMFDYQNRAPRLDQAALESRPITIGWIGRLDPIKGVEIFLRAFSQLGWLKSSRALIVGDGPATYKQALENLAFRLGVGPQVEFRSGSEIPYSIHEFDIGVSSSLSEGFSNTIAEMMSCTIPCVVSDVGDSALIVDGTGIVVPAGSPESLRDGLERLLGEGAQGWQRRGRAARQRIEEYFSMEKLVTRTESTLLKLLVGSSISSTTSAGG